jgi:hypothetical protein
MEIKVDKTFVVVLICSLLFGNLLYMWGRYIGIGETSILKAQIEELDSRQSFCEELRDPELWE